MSALFMQAGGILTALHADRNVFARMAPHIPHVRFGERGAGLFPVAYVRALQADPRLHASAPSVGAFSRSRAARQLTGAAREQFNAAFNGDRLFTVDEIAGVLGVTRNTVYNWYAAGLFPGTQHFSTAEKRPLLPGENGRTEIVVPGTDILHAACWVLPIALRS